MRNVSRRSTIVNDLPQVMTRLQQDAAQARAELQAKVVETTTNSDWMREHPSEVPPE